MNEKIIFSDNEIESVCKELGLPKDAFKEVLSERRKIIDNWKSANIIACPGSGKTTVLLVKLMLLANRMPFDDRRGICVLTHTNVAIDEIRSKLGSKADILFQHPNFFGTIQSFVNKFLAVPAFKEYGGIKQKNINLIDSDFITSRKKNEYYKIGFGQNGNKTLCNYLYGDANRNKKELHYKVKNINAIKLLNSLKFDITDNIIKRPDGKTFLKNLTNNNYKEVKRVIFSLWESGYLSFEDAFNFATWYTKKYSEQLHSLFEKRFKFLFADEMQDTQKYQMDIINSVFNNKVIKQYYGDPDQSIFSDDSDSDISWDYKNNNYLIFEITDSIRYGVNISNCIYPFRRIISSVKGHSKRESLKPCILLYDKPKDAVNKYFDLIKTNKLTKESSYINWDSQSSPFNLIGYVGKIPDDGSEKLTIHSYTKNFSKESKNGKMFFDSLISYFQKRPQNEILNSGSKIYYNLFINALIRVYEYNNKPLNKNTLKQDVFDCNPEFYSEFNLNVYLWIKGIELGDLKPNIIKEEFIAFFKIWNPDFTFEDSFFTTSSISSNLKVSKKSNLIIKGKTKVKVGTIHSVKGETHIATLLVNTENYCESESTYFLNPDSSNKNKLLFCGDAIISNKVRINQRLKSTYVGFSRPTHLLCFAVHKEKAKCKDCNKKNCNWNIITC